MTLREILKRNKVDLEEALDVQVPGTGGSPMDLSDPSYRSPKGYSVSQDPRWDRNNALHVYYSIHVRPES